MAIQLVAWRLGPLRSTRAGEAMKRLLAGEITSAQSPGVNRIVVLSLRGLGGNGADGSYEDGTIPLVIGGCWA
jgi:hypothetical protein